jgi:hypothetical protein
MQECHESRAGNRQISATSLTAPSLPQNVSNIGRFVEFKNVFFLIFRR